MKAIHNKGGETKELDNVVLYPKDTEKWKQFTTNLQKENLRTVLFCIPKILKNESNSQHTKVMNIVSNGCFVSQRYWKMKAIHNSPSILVNLLAVVLYPKDTEKWKQFTTRFCNCNISLQLFCIPKILKNESNSQLSVF